MIAEHVVAGAQCDVDDPNACGGADDMSVVDLSTGAGPGRDPLRPAIFDEDARFEENVVLEIETSLITGAGLGLTRSLVPSSLQTPPLMRRRSV